MVFNVIERIQMPIGHDALKSEEKRLRTEQADRLKELRTQLAWTDWQELSAIVAAAQSQVEQRLEILKQAENEQTAAIEARQRVELALQDVATEASSIESYRNDCWRFR